jgi:Protein of unknown function (DUF2946)
VRPGKRPDMYLRWAAWLGVVALAINALVPIHLAFDLADAVGPAHHHEPHLGDRDPQRDFLAVLVGHHHDSHDKSNGHGSDHQTTCPVCGAFGAVTGLALASTPPLPVPAATSVASPMAAPENGRAAPSAASYRSRAPPLA